MDTSVFSSSTKLWPQVIHFVGSDLMLRERLEGISDVVLWFEFDRLLIKDAQEIRKELGRKLAPDHHQISVIKANTIGTVPQNALLKSIEEPASGHRVIFCLPTLDEILPTILSRGIIIRGDTPANQIKNPLQKWLSQGILDRLAEADVRVKQAQKEQTTALLRNQIRNEIMQLEQYLYTNNTKSNNYATLKELQQLRLYLANQGASPKYILEYLALLLPTT